MRLALIAAAVLVLVAGSAIAQDGGYEIPWFTVDGGGGQISGGEYSLIVTMGQPCAGEVSGGAYSMTSGFLPGAKPLSYRYLPIIMR